MQRDQVGDAARGEHDDHQEKQPEIEQPGLGVVGKRGLQQRHQHRADDRPPEMADAPYECHQDHVARGHYAQRLRGDDLVVDRGQPAAHAGEEPGQRHHQPAHARGIVADELGSFGVVAHRVGDAPQRRLCDRKHSDDADQAPSCDQIIDLDLRTIADANYHTADGAVGGDTTLPAEESCEHERTRRHHLCDAERDHRERCARAASGDETQHQAEKHSREPAHQGHERHRKPESAGAYEVQCMRAKKRTEAEINGVTERQQSGLTEQHVVRQRKNDRNAHLREHGQCETLGEDERQQSEKQDHRGPENDAAPGNGRTHAGCPAVPRPAMQMGLFITIPACP